MSVRAPERRPRPVHSSASLAGRAPAPAGKDGPALDDVSVGAQEAPPASVWLTAAAVMLSGTGAAWMSAGLFTGMAARGTAVGGVGVGVGMVALSYATRRPSLVQHLVLPVAVVVGGLLVLPSTTPGHDIPGLIGDVLRAGGIAQAPIPFDPGWRFILLVFTALLGAGSLALAIGLERPKLGVCLPLPVLFGAALLQPPKATLWSGLVVLGLVLLSVAVCYGVDLDREGATSPEFEARRFARAGVTLAVVLAAMALMSRIGFLFPEPQRHQSAPPSRPQTQPIADDAVLFTVRAQTIVPWRLGVLDVYDGRRWLTAPFDSGRLRDISKAGDLPTSPGSRNAPGVDDTRSLTAAFHIVDLKGQAVPAPPNPAKVHDLRGNFSYDPRTQGLRLTSQVGNGVSYTVDAPVSPAPSDLARAPAAPQSFKPVLRVPLPPSQVAALLADAPTTSAWERLQYVRERFEARAVGGGAGDPADVTPARVVQILAGSEASPYEITASEALLARWAGIPARMGYGFIGGDQDAKRPGDLVVRPRNGATWLEAYFEGYGWVPVVGAPGHATASISPQPRQESSSIQPSDRLAVIVYLPIKVHGIQALYSVIRYWVMLALLVTAGALALLGVFPGLVKLARRTRRRRWASLRGPRERIAVAYAELRDGARDLKVGDVADTPLAMVGRIGPDSEHRELAWLVSRALWGDLRRDLRVGDALAAEEMSASVLRRLRGAHSVAIRATAFAARASLRSPWSDEIPNLWPAPRPRPGSGDCRERVGWRRVLKPAASLPAAALAMVVLMVACGQGRTAATNAPARDRARAILEHLAPPTSVGGYELRAEPAADRAFTDGFKDSLVDDGRVFTVRQGEQAIGYLETASFKPGLKASDQRLRDNLTSKVAGGRFVSDHIGLDLVYTLRSERARFILWMPPRGRYFQLLVAGQGFADPERLMGALLAQQRSGDAGAAFRGSAPVIDPRRGGDQ